MVICFFMGFSLPLEVSIEHFKKMVKFGGWGGGFKKNVHRFLEPFCKAVLHSHDKESHTCIQDLHFKGQNGLMQGNRELEKAVVFPARKQTTTKKAILGNVITSDSLLLKSQ